MLGNYCDMKILPWQMSTSSTLILKSHITLLPEKHKSTRKHIHGNGHILYPLVGFRLKLIRLTFFISLLSEPAQVPTEVESPILAYTPTLHHLCSLASGVTRGHTLSNLNCPLTPVCGAVV